MMRKLFASSSPFKPSPAMMGVSYLLLAIWSVFVLFPLYWLFVTAFKLPIDVSSGPKYLMWVDFEPSTHAWQYVLDEAGDDEPVPFSFVNNKVDSPQIPCWMTYTNEKIHKLLRENLHRAPLSSGQIKGADPRYCPSIEGKVISLTVKSSL